MWTHRTIVLGSHVCGESVSNLAMMFGVDDDEKPMVRGHHLCDQGEVLLTPMVRGHEIRVRCYVTPMVRGHVIRVKLQW